MKILHTADWHLGMRLGRIDRTEDLRRAIDRVMEVCEREGVEVLVIAGDLFDNVYRSDDVCNAIGSLNETVRPFLRGRGTILAVTGNHDGETFPATLQHALGLADPRDYLHGCRLEPGRFYLANRARLFRLADRDGLNVQFALMPYPLPSRYLDDPDELDDSGGLASRILLLRQKFADQLARMRADDRFDTRLPSVLVTHLFLRGATLPNGQVITTEMEQDHIVCPSEELGAGWAYVALGDIHKPQILGGQPNVRYSGGIERLGFNERENEIGVVLIDVGPEGLRGEPTWVPLEATPMLDLTITNPSEELPRLKTDYPDADTAIVKCRVMHRVGEDHWDEIRRQIEEVFPRLYRLDPIEAGRPVASPSGSGSALRRSLRETVMEYLRQRLDPETDPLAGAVLASADELIEEVSR